MARVEFLKKDQANGAALEAWEAQEENNNLTNMKKALLLDYPTYDAYMAWYTSWKRLVEVVGERAAVIYAHAISTTNSCQLCSLFFISDLQALGLDPFQPDYNEKEQVLARLGEKIVKNPTAVSDELFEELKKYWTDPEIVAIVGFAGQMIATNNFNSVLQIDVDQRLVPIIDQFRPAVWRDHIS